jgi:hypothetical protein
LKSTNCSFCLQNIFLVFKWSSHVPWLSPHP